MKLAAEIALIAAIAAAIVFLYIQCKRHGIKNVRVSRAFAQRGVFEDQTAELVETVYNAGFLPALGVDVIENIDANLRLPQFYLPQGEKMQQFVSRFFFLPFLQIRRRYSLRCQKRGCYRLETVEIYSLGSSRFLPAETMLYVYPKPLPVEEVPLFAPSAQGELFSRQPLYRDPFSFSGVRDYGPGDSFRSINFKATAKTGALKVNTYDFSASRNEMIYLNFQTVAESVGGYVGGYVESEKNIELGLRYAASIAESAVEQGARAGFAANCRLVSGEGFIHIPPAGGREHLEEILRQMASAVDKMGISFYSLLDMDLDHGLYGMEIFVITPYMNEKIERQLDAFRRFGNTVNVVRLQEDTGDAAKEKAAEEERREV